MIEEVLRRIGLTDSEIKVYIALLDLGESTSGDILNKAGLRTGKIYEILFSLERKGLISQVQVNGMKRFSPADPRRVYEMLEKHKEEINQQEKSFKDIVPNLLAKIKSKKKPINIEIFTGFDGLKTAYLKETNYYKKGDTLYVLGILPKEAYQKKEYDFFIYNIYPKREKTGISIKKLYSENAKKDKSIQEKKAQIKYIPYEYTPSINVIGELTTISISAGDQTLHISIENEEVAKGFIKQFELLWKSAKK